MYSKTMYGLAVRSLGLGPMARAERRVPLGPANPPKRSARSRPARGPPRSLPRSLPDNLYPSASWIKSARNQMRKSRR